MNKITTLALLGVVFATSLFFTVDFRTPPDGDAMFFLPQIVSFARGEGLRNTVYKIPLAYHPSHDGRHIWHGFAYQTVAGLLPWAKDYAGLSRIIAVLNLLTLAFTSAAVWRLLAKPAGLSRGAGCILVLLVICETGYLWGLSNQGRPETFSSLLLAAGIVLMPVVAKRRQAFVAGPILALMALTSPAQTVIIAPLAIGLLAINADSWRDGWRTVALAGVSGLAAAAILFVLYPYSPAEWLQGLRIHARTLVNRNLTGSYRIWLVMRGCLFMGGLTTVAAAGAFFLVYGMTMDQWRKRVLIMAVTLAVIPALYFSISVAAFYNMSALIPLLVVVVAMDWKRWGEQTALRPRIAWYARTCIVLMLSAVALDPVFTVAARIMEPRGMTLAEARAEFSRLRLEHKSIAITKGLFPLTEDYDNIEALIHEEYAMGSTAITRADILVVQQVNQPDWSTPPRFSNYKLVKNLYVPVNQRVIPNRLKRWWQPSGYGFAVYIRI